MLLIDQMTAGLEDLAITLYRESPPLLATDASPITEIRKRLEQFGRGWIKRFDKWSPIIARSYVRKAFKHTDSAMRQALRSSGWAIKFEMTPAMRQAAEASIVENVGLIRSIPQEYLQQVQGIVMRSYTAGRDLGTMTADLKKLYPRASNRAALISRDQSNKLNGVVIRARQMDLGITEAVWMHSHAGKHPRPTHVKQNGKRYKIEDGWYDPAVKRFILPGELINCRCTSRAILPFNIAK